MDIVSPNFVILTRSKLGLLPVISCSRVIALDICLNFVSSQYLWNKAFLQHEKHCSEPIIRFCDISSFIELQSYFSEINCPI